MPEWKAIPKPLDEPGRSQFSIACVHSGNDLLTARGITARHSKDNGVIHAWAGQQGGFHVGGIKLSTSHIDGIAHATAHEDSAFVEFNEVAGDKAPFAQDHLISGKVSLSHIGPANHQTSVLVGRQSDAGHRGPGKAGIFTRFAG